MGSGLSVNKGGKVNIGRQSADLEKKGPTQILSEPKWAGVFKTITPCNMFKGGRGDFPLTFGRGVRTVLWPTVLVRWRVWFTQFFMRAAPLSQNDEKKW